MKDLFTFAEAVEHFELSAKKFRELLKGQHDFIIYYRKRKMIIRVLFQEYLEQHPELRRCRKWAREVE